MEVLLHWKNAISESLDICQETKFDLNVSGQMTVFQSKGPSINSAKPFFEVSYSI